MSKQPEKFELETIEKLDAVQVFTGGGVDPILLAITEEVRSHEPDITNDKGRKAIASLAFKVSQSKVLLDKAGKSLVTGWKENAKAVDLVRKTVRDSLDELRDEARQPLTDWEEEEEAREAAEILAYKVSVDHDEALGMNDIVNREIELAKKEAAIALAEEKRLAEVAAAEAEKERIRRDEKVRQKAIAEEKRLAEAEKIRVATEAKESLEKLEREKREAEINAEVEKREAKERAARAKIQAEEEKQQAVEDERKRVEGELEKERLATQKREANEAHKKKLNNAALSALCGIIKEADAKKIIAAIARGEVPHITINY